MPRQKPRWRTVSPEIAERAKELRKQQTPAETLLWSRLRNSQLYGLHFRRQHAIDRFICDFYQAEARLVIEVDGDVHAYAEQMAKDRERDMWFAERGYHVVRFTNDDVIKRLDGVLMCIAVLCEVGQAPTRPPPSSGGGD